MALPRAASIHFHSEIYAFSIACHHGPGKQSTHLKYMVQGPATTILDIYLFFHQNGVKFLCVRLWAGLVYFSLSPPLPLSLSPSPPMVSEFAVEDLPLGRTTALLPEFAVKDLPLGRTL